LGLIKETILLLSFFTAGCYFFNKRLLIPLYIILLPTDGIFLQEYNLAGVVNINVIINFITLLSLAPELFKKYKVTTLQKYANHIVVILLLYLIFWNIKDAYFDLIAYEKATNRIIYYLVEYLPLFLIIRLLNKPDINELLKSSIYFSLIFLTICAILSPYLASFGFKIGAEDGMEFSTINRFDGIFGKGDENSFGVFCSMILGFLFANNEKKKINFYEISVLIFSITGVLLSGSRAAVISLLIIVFYFLRRSSDFGITLKIIFVLLVFGVIFAPWIELVLSRFNTLYTQLDFNTSSNRIGKWSIYLNHMLSNPSIFLYGNEATFSLTSYSGVRAAHNFYIQMLYNLGAIPVTLLITYLFRLYFVIPKNSLYLNPVYYTLPVIMETMTVSAFATLPFFCLIIASNSSYLEKS